MENLTRVTETPAEMELSDFALKDACMVFARTCFQGKTFTNKETGRRIIVSSDGLGEWKSKTKSREQILSIKILDKLLENALFDHDASDKLKRPEIEGFSYFKTPCDINGQRYLAIISIKRVKNYGDKYYHHYLDTLEIAPQLVEPDKK
jgi:hypothetical protein